MVGLSVELETDSPFSARSLVTTSIGGPESSLPRLSHVLETGAARISPTLASAISSDLIRLIQGANRDQPQHVLPRFAPLTIMASYGLIGMASQRHLPPTWTQQKPASWPTAQEDLIPLVYNELRRLARGYRRRAGARDTLQTTEIVHKAYLRLVDIDNVEWQDRVHFFAVSAQLMRRILVDTARTRAAAKRGSPAGAIRHLDLDELPAPDSHRATELIALDDCLTHLALQDVIPAAKIVCEFCRKSRFLE